MDFDRLVTKKILRYLAAYPCVAILGPRQVGKTTTVKMLQRTAYPDAIYLDLESAEDLQKLSDPEQYFNQRTDKLIIIDEIQRKPDLFPLLRSVIDKRRVNGRFILLGSASPELLAHSSETLAGRVAYLEMHPLLYNEVKAQFNFNDLWLKGGFPNIFLQHDLSMSFDMKLQFIQTYLERELPILGLFVSPVILRNLIKIVAHSQGQLTNYTDFSNSLGVEVNTVKRYLDYFESAFLIRRLQPYYANSKKRIIKSPKIYIRDTGLYHTLFNIVDREDLDGFAGKGHSWESFIVQQTLGILKQNVNPYFYRTQDGSELDLVLESGGIPVLGIEIKYSNAPKITKGTLIASQDLGDIPVLAITHSVQEDYAHNDKIMITSFERLPYYLEKYKLI